MRVTSEHSDLVGAVHFILNPNETIPKILEGETRPSALLQNIITPALKDEWLVSETFDDYVKLYKKICCPRQGEAGSQKNQGPQLMDTLKKTVFPAAKLRMPEKLRGLLQNNKIDFSEHRHLEILEEFATETPFEIQSIESIPNETILMLKELLCWASRLVTINAIKAILEKDSNHLTTKIIDYKEFTPSFFDCQWMPSLFKYKTGTRKLLEKRSSATAMSQLEYAYPDGNIEISRV